MRTVLEKYDINPGHNMKNHENHVWSKFSREKWGDTQNKNTALKKTTGRLKITQVNITEIEKIVIEIKILIDKLTIC